MTSFLQVAPVANFFFMLDLRLWFFFQVVLIDGFFASSHESFADFFFRLRPSLFLFHISRPSLTSISGCAHRWFFLRSRPSLILPQVTHVAGFFPGRMSKRRWLPSQVAHIADFFPRSRPLLIFPQVTHVADFFFLVARLRRWLLFQVAHMAEFF